MRVGISWTISWNGQLICGLIPPHSITEKQMHRPPQQYQQTMFDSERPATCDSGPVTCLGMTFENDDARREGTALVEWADVFVV